ncbi:hypothetical protein E2562_031094 [Oryza meyeriana var. granulata]|uniref:Secreted protein n=1 Tax=Oryza meyeriana var. granulata TaxID=110450 RepID=A0A6G1E4Q5_9ORYZ|nr:hypothetical protein E2562_031094 [Oryza meyeriana var. granulata]
MPLPSTRPSAHCSLLLPWLAHLFSSLDRRTACSSFVGRHTDEMSGAERVDADELGDMRAGDDNALGATRCSFRSDALHYLFEQATTTMVEEDAAVTKKKPRRPPIRCFSGHNSPSTPQI